MSLYLALGITALLAVFLRFRYGSRAIAYAAAVLLLILFLYCPTTYYPGIRGPIVSGQSELDAKVDRLGDVVSFGLLVVAAWIAGGPWRKKEA